MTDPFVQGAAPQRVGFARIDQDASLYYEIRGQDSAQERVLMIMGAFATSRKFDCIATAVADHGYQVLSYHHRNIGKTQSPASKHVPQTPATLAHDAVALIDHIWGPSAPVHVFGASMGGVVAQHTAVMLHQKGRLRSLFVNVTWDGSGRLGSSWLASFLKPMCTLPVVRHILLPLVFPHRNNPDKQAMNTMKSTYSSTDLARPYTGIGTHVLPPNPTVRDAWHHIWSTHMDEWFCWRDPDATAVQLHLIIHTTPVDVSSLRNDPTVPPRCSVYVAEEDALVPPAQQEAVAVRLGTTNVLRLRSGHMIGWEEDYQRYLQFLLHHLDTCSITTAKSNL